MIASTNANPVLGSPRLEELTSWDADWSGLPVVVVGIGVAGFAAADTLIELGANVVVVDGKVSEETRNKAETLKIVGAKEVLLGQEFMSSVPLVEGQQAELVVTSPGLRPDQPLLAQARELGIQIWGDVELAWRIRERAGRKTAEWVCITGTNGKTTTVQMTEAMLQAGGLKAIAVGNVGTPVLDALRDPVEYDVLAVELSSFQLHWQYSVSPLAAVCLNIAEDHVDWHGSFQNYLADKSRVYENCRVAAVYNVADQSTLHMVEEADVVEGCRAIGFTAGHPQPSMLGVVEDLLVDRAFLDDRRHQALELASVTELKPVPTVHGVANALAAAALARAAGVDAPEVGEGLRRFEPGAHRIQPVAKTNGVVWINDSKATNPHAANASLSAFDPVVWIAGGLAKGTDSHDLVAQHAHRLRAVVLIGTDNANLTAALAQHAPDVPVIPAVQDAGQAPVDAADGDAVMRLAVAAAHRVAVEGDTVLLAPAAASMDQFKDYAHRGQAFTVSVADLVERLS
ncbi:UDP-N-acetylmuramoyl-L-alanine--D-glutamate ligase [Kocuria sp.]|uniref:UDP-N-acetylmuramoyl-L-alanine--D-glutamate ligase n=1 Tax=Kocuria sp. TaxID=1871328 RepID=UPI0026DF3D5F|nr:UDP-N-acetylmuramoyl-L-alanine--D-glutamate ligase [Kocuria sp.]MDO5618453.1 UDP-N-acetylmuramoyl-L-alanine--D-glutamate ligase [Kocuria sp.]